MMLKQLHAFPGWGGGIRHRLYIYHKGDSKWIIDLTVNWKTIKFLEDNIGENLDALQMMMLFTYNKDTIHKKIIGKLDFIKIKIFCSVRDSRGLEDKPSHKQMQRSSTSYVREICIKT